MRLCSLILLVFVGTLLIHEGDAFALKAFHRPSRTSLEMSLETQDYTVGGSIPKSMQKLTRKETIKKTILPLLLSATAACTMMSTSTVANAAQFLKEPTEDFKAETAKTQALAAKEKKIRAEFDVLLQKFVDTPESDALENNPTEKNLRALINFLKPLDGVPSGIKKLDIVKPCRAKKFSNPKRREIKKTWTKECEIAYQELIQLFNRKMRYARSDLFFFLS